MVVRSERNGARALTAAEFAAIYRAVAPYTMVTAPGVVFTATAAVAAVLDDIPGSLVECGVWKGGAALAMLLAQRQAFGFVRKRVHLFDSFAGLPPAAAIDGPAAAAWQRDTSSPRYFDNCRATRGEVDRQFSAFGFTPLDYEIHQGQFEHTVPFFGLPIALLRLDADWYAATRFCLNNLMPHVSPRATVIVDDYYAWDGCARAVHDWLSAHNRPYRIRSLPELAGACFTHAP